MADVAHFFGTYLPEKLTQKPDLGKEINACYQFDIAIGDETKIWSVDLRDGKSEVREGATEGAGCVVSAKKEDFEALLDNPGQAVMLFMQGKLKVTNVGLAMSLQKILG
jgi:hypothetical protein